MVSTPVDATEDIVAAADQLARAIARATVAERAAAAARLDRLALPAPDRAPPPVIARSIRDAIVPAPPISPPPPRRFATVISLVDRLVARLPPRLERVVSRVRALAA